MVVVVFAENIIVEVKTIWISLKEIADWKPVYKCFVVGVLLSATVSELRLYIIDRNFLLPYLICL